MKNMGCLLMNGLGVAILTIGILALVYVDIRFNREKLDLDETAVTTTAMAPKEVPIATIAGGITIVAGLLLLVFTSRQDPEQPPTTASRSVQAFERERPRRSAYRASEAVR